MKRNWKKTAPFAPSAARITPKLPQLRKRVGQGIEGEGVGSIKKAVADEAALRLAKDNELAQDIADEVSARTAADTDLERRIAAFEGDGAGSVAAQIKGVQDQELLN